MTLGKIVKTEEFDFDENVSISSQEAFFNSFKDLLVTWMGRLDKSVVKKIPRSLRLDKNNEIVFTYRGQKVRLVFRRGRRTLRIHFFEKRSFLFFKTEHQKTHYSYFIYLLFIRGDFIIPAGDNPGFILQGYVDTTNFEDIMKKIWIRHSVELEDYLDSSFRTIKTEIDRAYSKGET